MINELIDQIGGRERLEKMESGDNFVCIQDDEGQLMARALLAVLDAQGKAFGCDSCGGNGEVVIVHGVMGVEHIECPKCFKIPPAASVPEWWKLVPLEPHWSMIDAAIKHHEGEAFLPVSLYKAMIAAAPTPENKK